MEHLNPRDPNVVLTVRDVTVSGFSTSDERETKPDYAYFHRDHVPAGYRIVIRSRIDSRDSQAN